MARNMFVFASGTGSEEGAMGGSAGGLMFMVGIIVISVAVMSMIIFGCADCADGNKPPRKHRYYGGGGGAAGAAACGGGGGGGGGCGGGGGGGGGGGCGGGGGGGGC